MSSTTCIDLLRHGEPDGGRRYRGQVDDLLNDAGWAQMREAVAGEHGWQRIVSSPLRRCLLFAEDLAGQRDIPVRTEPDLREVGFGEWEGCSHDELSAREPGILERFRADPVAFRPPGAEPLQDFHARVINSFERVRKEYAGQHTLIIAHAGVIRAILCHVLDAPLSAMYRIRVDYASMSRVHITDDGNFTLIFHNRQGL